MASFTLKTSEQGGVLIVEIQGYFAGDAGAALQTLADEQCRAGRLKILLDFSACNVVSSPGVAALMEITLRITEDFQGKTAMCGLDTLKRNVFSMAGITSIAPECADRATGVQELQK